MNHITLTGRITQELELRHTGKVDIVNYQLACRRDKDTTDFINITTFGEFAKTLCQYCHKGDLIGIEGRLQISQYEKDGKKYSSYSVISEKVEFLNTKKEEKEEKTTSTQTSIKQDEIIVDDDMLPF